ncbi:MAG: hypothetical protein K6G11_09215 [Lachnospiraceae bacterium]|nr:hypothetical protein [Lachnospiraceae bacterium]
MEKEIILDIIADYINVDSSIFSADTNFASDMGLSEADIREIIVNVEEKFKVILSEEKIESIRTIKDLVDNFTY